MARRRRWPWWLTLGVGLALGASVGACAASTSPAEPDAAVDAASSPACAAPVTAGTFELHLIPMLNFRLGDRFELAPDGHFSGFDDGRAYTLDTTRCDGALTPDELARLTDAVNAATLFCVTDWPESGGDHYAYDVTIRTATGARENRFCGYGHDGTYPPFDAVVGVAREALLRAAAEGGCTGPAYPVDARTDRCVP